MTDLRLDAADWSDDRIERALAALADDLVVPDEPEDITAPPRRPALRRLLAAAAVALAAAAGIVAAVPDARDAVAGWFGLGSVRLERVALPAPQAGGLPRLTDGVVAVDVDQAMAEADVSLAALDAAGLGRPDEAGRPPEGGVVLVWRQGSTTLWIRTVEDAPMVIKRLADDDRAELVAGLGEAAVLIEGDHVLATPARELAADRVLWWVAGTREFRLESDRPGGELVDIGRALGF